MNQPLTDMLRYHAAHNHSEEIRQHCREMLDMAEIDADPAPPRHHAQSVLTSPEQRAAYLASLARSPESLPHITDNAAEDERPALVVWLLVGAIALIIVGVAQLYRWWP